MRRPVAFTSQGYVHQNATRPIIDVKLELLALKWSITEKFREYLLGIKFTVYTDNDPISYLQKTIKLVAKY